MFKVLIYIGNAYLSSRTFTFRKIKNVHENLSRLVAKDRIFISQLLKVVETRSWA